MRENQLWTFDADAGLMRSDNSRPDVNPCDYRQYDYYSSGARPCVLTFHRYVNIFHLLLLLLLFSPFLCFSSTDEEYECEVEHTVEPFMCLAVYNDTVEEYVSATPCAAPARNMSIGWEVVPAQAAEAALAFDGLFQRIPLFSFSPPNSEAYQIQPSPLRLTAETHCQRGVGNDTCIFACDGSCDEAERMEPSFRGASCEPHTDQFDCDPASRVVQCARLCANDPLCMSFSTDQAETHTTVLDCRFFTVRSRDMPDRMYARHLSTQYDRVGPPSASLPPALQPVPAKPCAEFDQLLCPTDRCILGIVPGQGAPEDPECRDSAAPTGFSCFFYLDSNLCDQDAARRQVKKKKKKKKKKRGGGRGVFRVCCASAMYSCRSVFRFQCPVTCEASEFCTHLRYACMEAEPEYPTEAPILTACPASDAVVRVNDKCRCEYGWECMGSACHNGTVRGRDPVTYFLPDCPGLRPREKRERERERRRRVAHCCVARYNCF